MTDDYSDIYDINYQGSSKRAHMSLYDRAAQFAPFAALTGYDGMVGEAARLTGSRLQLSEEELFVLNEKIHLLSDCIKEQPQVRLTYFVPDRRKEGGSYCTAEGNARRIDEINRVIILTDDTEIGFDTLYKIESEEF